MTIQKVMDKMDSENEIIFFPHIFKSAGNTFRNIVKRQYSESEFLSYYPRPWMTNIEKEIQELMNDFPKGNIQLKAVFGHFVYGIHKGITRPYRYITFVRNPAERYLSGFYHVMRLQEDVKKIFFPSGLDLNTFIKNKETHNHLIYFFTGIPREQIEKHSEEAIAIAKENILREYLFVGLTEKFDESIIILKKLLKWNSVYYDKRNVGTNRLEENNLDTDLLNEIIKLNKLDYIIYEFVVDLFEEKLKQYHLNKGEVKLFKSLNRCYNLFR